MTTAWQHRNVARHRMSFCAEGRAHDTGKPWKSGFMKRDEPFKPIGHVRPAKQGASSNAGVGEGSGKQAIEELKNSILVPLESDIHKLRDPLVLAALMHTAATERENANRLLKTLIEKLDSRFAEVEERLEALEGRTGAEFPAAAGAEGELLLPSVDTGILEFVRERRHVSAEDVRRRFGYRGKNAASSRLNRLIGMGLLGKRQVGRVVMFFAKQP